MNTPTLSQLVHEKQQLQLCAVHTVNNLLQLSNTNSMIATTGIKNNTTVTDEEENTRMIVIDGKLYKQSLMNTNNNNATKAEFTEIANEMTYREQEAYKAATTMTDDDTSTGGGGSSTTATTRKGGGDWMMMTGIFSNHRTPLTGNYSFEVLEEALMKRGVIVNWFPLENMMMEKNTTTAMIDPTQYIKKDEEEQEEEEYVVIGYVVNRIHEHYKKTYSIQSMVKSLVPFISTGRHWLAVTRIRATTTTTTTTIIASDDNDGTTTTLNDDDGKKWYWLDSDQKEHVTISDDSELITSLLKIVHDDGGNVFQAVVPASSLEQVSL